uniref:Putative rho gtpase activating protein at 1a n=1 Tax=Corethrella appendiculata TaxID=1370023 RepID=W4VRB6_9DIPT
MSVFSDFQRMWNERFPQSSLSDAWEQDVRASLVRHKQKIAELTKELEQETLYVEYLERLLSDVEKFRESGGDPTAMFEAGSCSKSVKKDSNGISGGSGGDHINTTANNLSSATENRETSSDNTIIKAVLNNNNDDNNKNNSSSNIDSESSTTTSNVDADNLVQLRKDGALNQCINELTSNLNTRRCFSEIGTSPIKSLPTSPTSTLIASSSSSPTSTTKITSSNSNIGEELATDTVTTTASPTTTAPTAAARSRHSSQSETLLSSPSHFVTVIEVKESNSDNKNSNNNNSENNVSENNITATTTAAATVSSTSTTTITSTSTPSPTTKVKKLNSYENVLINTNIINNSVNSETNINNNNNNNNLNNNSSSEQHSTFFDNNHFKQQKPTAPILTPPTTTERSSILLSSSTVQQQSHQQPPEIKKKVPPRPPPKYPRRAAPVEPPTVPINITTAKNNINNNNISNNNNNNNETDKDSPSSSLERNVKPSEILQRQKSSDSLDIKLTSRKIDKLSKSTDLIEDFKTSDSPTGSLGKLATNISNDSPTGSLDKNSNRANSSLQSIGSKESLASGGGIVASHITERIKSYESISSLSSDSMKTNLQHLEHEHYYDTVPLDNGDGDYVYIQAGGSSNNNTNGSNNNNTGTTGSTSSRDDISTAGSTLPMPSHTRSHNSSQTSVQLEPESPGRSSNYVNIDYFINSQNHETRSSSIDSDGEIDISGGPPPIMRAISIDNSDNQSGVYRKVSNANRNTIIRQIVTSIITSETLYVECLNKMKQYMKAIRATLTTSQPVISEEEFRTMFFKIEDLHEVHSEFLAELKYKQSQSLSDSNEELCIGDAFRKLAGHINLYGAFLHNYGHAIDTVKKCGANCVQFKEIVSKIVFKNSQNEQSLSLEELLHKPVARVQKNALVLQDLLNQTPDTHPDYQPLRQAQKIIRNFLSEFNVVQTKSLFPSDDKALRRLVKNSFIVELADGHRKLRHLFLFNDVIACAKYRAFGRDRFEFELKWFIPLKDILICEESSNDPKETSPINIVQLKSQACTVRDQIMLDEKDEKLKRSNGSRAGDKHRKKLADLEAQLVLASPNLVLKISNKGTGKTMTFFLSSDFERTQWIDSILTLQQSCNLPGQQILNVFDLQAWITACQALIKTEMGSYLMRNARDESLLVGDLHLTIQGLVGLEQPCDLFICVEIDSYGHYFRKAKTKLVCRSASPLWNESFVLELEGSQNIRILLYEDNPHRPILRAKHILKLSRQWLQDAPVNKTLRLSDSITLNTTIRFVPGEVTLRRVPTSKPGALFGAKLQSVVKREKRDIPFIISACVREVERRGMYEVGIYRVSGSASDLAKLKKSFETNAYEAEQLLKEVDIHSVTGILKSYLRDLPEALFTDLYYQRLFETYTKFSNINEQLRIEALQKIFNELPQPNKSTINLLLDHLIKIHQQEVENKMSLHNLAMVFGPTLLRPGPQNSKQKDLLESSTVDVMAQAGILYCFLQAKLK